ncbi:MAG: glycosyltransferase family 39 protein [Deltaproteobacteria bacterium]|nr:glycosyltransferase family 39 protein [Deltaproteobacteria bacterium]
MNDLDDAVSPGMERSNGRSNGRSTGRSRSKVRLAVGAIVVFYFLVQLAGLPAFGLTDDDDFYIPAGISYSTWLGHALTLRDGAFSQAQVDAAFSINKEHPPFAKYVFGVCHFALRGLVGPFDSARVGTVLFSTVAALLLCILAIHGLGRRRGLLAGGCAVLCLLLLPRFYFHSHAATLDVPVATMYLATATLALMAERSWRAAIASGAVFGLATATKLNAPFFLLPYGVFLLLTRMPRFVSAPESATFPARLRSWFGGGTSEAPPRPDAGFVRLPRIPLTLVAMATVGPLVFWGSWPWLWWDTFARVGEYVGFHLHHYGIYFLYFGRIYSSDPYAPWHAPFVMAATTVPLAIWALLAAGVLLGRRALWGSLRASGEARLQSEGSLLLTALLHLFFTISVVAFFPGPKYGGEKLFMPAFPFICLLAGYGALRLCEAVREGARVSEERSRGLGSSLVSGLRSGLGFAWVGWVTVGVALLSSLALGLRFGAYALSSYNGLAGGLAGATALGFERQYYDVAYRDLVVWFNEHAEKGATVHFLPNNWEYVRTYRWYARGGFLRPDLRVVDHEAQASYIVITHERRFSRYSDDLLRYRATPIAFERRVDGVPLYTVLRVR